jgi:predicted nuclease of predicted toxin-antitoxin system
LKLLIDENISPEVTRNLRTLGYDVNSARESCKGCPDEEIVEIAKKEERTIITFDLDFGELYRNLGVSSIVLRLKTKRPSAVLKCLLDFFKTMSDQKIDMKNKLAVIKEGKIRLIG